MVQAPPTVPTEEQVLKLLKKLAFTNDNLNVHETFKAIMAIIDNIPLLIL